MLSKTELPRRGHTPNVALLSHLSQAQCVWLGESGAPHPSALRIMNGARLAGLHLDVFCQDRLPMIPFWRYDLVVLEIAHNQDLTTTVNAIKRARLLSTAPIIVLAPHVEVEFMIASLDAGADSVDPICTTEQVLLAYWGALLRRRATHISRPVPPFVRRADCADPEALPVLPAHGRLRRPAPC
jgi:hypothetical protein